MAARGPKPPAFKRVEVRAIAAVVVILTLIAALEVSLLIRKDLAEDEHARISVTKKEFDDAMNRVQARVDAVQKVKDEIKAKQDELNALQARIDFFSNDLAYRTVLVWTLLEKLAGTTGENVLIDAVEETPNLGFRIAGWALTEHAAKQFIQAFKAAMER